MNEQSGQQGNVQVGLERFLKEVWAAGEKDGKEHLAVVNGEDGHKMVWEDGDYTSVELSEKTKEILTETKNGIIVHNHPHECALSLQDIMVGARFKMPIYAITQSGWVSWTDRYKRSSIEMMYRNATELSQDLWTWMKMKKIKLALNPASEQDYMLIGLHAHILNLTLDKQKWINYKFTMPREIEEWVDENIELLGYSKKSREFRNWRPNVMAEV